MITVVSGFGRCGSSVVMQMLTAGGMPSFGGEYPAFESPEAIDLPEDHKWLAQADGYCLKILDIHRHWPPKNYRIRFIWLDRDAQEQAKSQAKFFSALLPSLLPMSKDHIRRLAASYTVDRPKCFRIMQERGEILILSFEGLLEDPLGTAKAISQFCGNRTDPIKMAQEVVDRPPQCLPYLLEIELLRRKDQEARHALPTT